MPTLLSSQDLAKSYASHTLFTGVGVQLVDDDRLGIIGPNGAGKSTLLKILAGIETPDTGTISRRSGLCRSISPARIEGAAAVKGQACRVATYPTLIVLLARRAIPAKLPQLH